MKKLNILESSPIDRNATKNIIYSYDNLAIKLYCLIRFRIIPMRFLDEILQYIPETGSVLDLGCGFGLFSLYFATKRPDADIFGIDINPSRIKIANESAAKLGLTNVHFICEDVRSLSDKHKDFAVVTAIDVLHHISFSEGNKLIEHISKNLLNQRGALLIKDVTTRPKAMLLFTYILDLLMNPADSFYYRDVESWKNVLIRNGFEMVETHYLWDMLPYPHILNVAKPAWLQKQL